MKTLQEIGNFFRKNAWYTIGGNLTNILSYANSILIGRLLGPSGLGDISSFAAYIGIFSIPIAILGTFVTQISSAEKNAVAIFNSIRTKVGYFLVILLSVCVGSVLCAPIIQEFTRLSVVGSILLLPDLWVGMLVVPLAALTLGGEKYKTNVIANITGATVKILAVPIIALFHWYSSDISIITISLGQIAVALLLWVYLDRYYPQSASPTIRRMVQFAKKHHLIYTVLGSASMILVANLDIVMARQLFDPKTAGIYATWSLLSKVVFFTLGPLLTVSFVKQAKKVSLGEGTLDSSVKMLVFFCLASMLPLFIGYQYIAPVFLKIVFGARFEALYQYLGLSGIFGALTLLLNHLTNTHIARQSWMSIWTIVCVAGFAIIAKIMSPNLSQYYFLINITVVVASVGLYLGLLRSLRNRSSVA